MASLPGDEDAHRVLGCYPATLRSAALTALGNRGGFSGARLWRGEADTGVFCLKAWPPADASAAYLTSVHALQQNAHRHGLAFVPEVFVTRDGGTFVEHAGRFWDVTSWQLGAADFHAAPSDARLHCAVRGVAQLHEVWNQGWSERRPCPALLRRLAVWRDMRELLRSGWRPTLEDGDDPVTTWAERAWRLLPEQLERVPLLLASGQASAVPVQPCLCDVWHDHLLFTGDVLTGLVDYGSVKIDHVAVDLARLLGSLVGDDASSWALALRAYREVRQLTPDEERLAHALDRTGVVLGAANWLRWLYLEQRRYDDRAAVADRLAALVLRLESRDARLIVE
jgi:homoserine kinase type II